MSPPVETPAQFARRSVMWILVAGLLVVGVSKIVGWPNAFARGVIAGTLGSSAILTLIALQARRLANIAQNKISSSIYAWSLLRVVLYGSTLYHAYTLDTVNGVGLLGAIVGLLLLQVVLVIRGALRAQARRMHRGP